MHANDQTSAVQQPEAPYCGSAIAISGLTTTVSGLASFNYRALDLASCGGLCGNPATKIIGIPFAEVHVVDGGGNIIQCGETDGSGNFSGLQIPRVAGSYTVQVFSRSLNSKVKASVLEDIYAATPYSVSTAFSTTAGQTTVTGLTMTASAQASVNAKIPGGGFNILADIYWANQFLRAQSGNASFVADKVTVFWKAGFNPYSYFGSPNALASFYVSSEDRLYILGGKNGDVKNSDTDHFDDSVILHEYGHFLEAHYGHSDSPGGSHNGDFIIDPRLAWSEGWANYFQGAVLDSVVYASGVGPKGTSGFTRYVDTIGYKSDPLEGSGTSAGILITRDLTEAAATAAYDKPGTNEGVFREFSISRTLFKTFKASIPFSAVWAAFTGLHDVTTVVAPPHKFINFGLFNYNLNTLITTPSQNTTWQGILTEEKQKADTTLYGNTLSEVAVGGGCAPTAMSPVADATYGYDRSNQLMSNDFYTYKHDGAARSITMTYSAGTPIQDLNLYIYSADYYYSEEVQEAQAGFANSTMLRTSKTVNVSSSTQSETVDLSGLPAGYYMIVVKAATLNRTAASLTGTPNYYLYSSTVNKCLTPN
jgi:hypothetical protein